LLDIDLSPSHRRLDHLARSGVHRAQMLAPGIEDFDLTVQRVPCVKALAAVAAPTPLTIDRPEMLKVV